MGGHAFRSRPNPPNIVRLPREQYIKLRDHYQRSDVLQDSTLFGLTDSMGSVLSKSYSRVVVPPEAPEKSDHGDIDVLVDGPLFNFTAQDLAQELGAMDYTKAGGTSSFAIRTSEDSDCFFQLDVKRCKQGCFEWESVIYSYGDIWHIIGSVATRFGLKINDSGLYARIGEIEATNRKDALLLLTSNTLDMMSFLGLDCFRYEKGFSTLDELFEWAVAMPLFRRRFFEKETTSANQGCAKERRPMYLKFVTEWLPQNPTLHTSTARAGKMNQERCQAEIPGAAHCQADWSAVEGNAATSPIDERKDLLGKALLTFNKGEEYMKMLEGHRRRNLKDAMWKKIALTLPIQGKELGQAMVALKNLLWWDDGQPRLKMEVDYRREKVPPLDAETVNMVLLPWIKEHWSEAVRLYEGFAH